MFRKPREKQVVADIARKDGYSPISIFAHWIAAIVVVIASGYLIPRSAGLPPDMFGLIAIP